MRSSKWHAHGNVYLLVEGEQVRGSGDLPAGVDGAVEITRVADDEVDVVIVNPDGSTAEMSGNGTRLAGAWLLEQTGGDVARVRVGPRLVTVRRTTDQLYETEIGEFEVGPHELVDGIELRTVLVGNPHAVVEGDPAAIGRVGPFLETHGRFPNRTNVEVVRVEHQGEAFARVWERGVGETSASGTGAVAVAAATHPDGEVVVHFPGGDLRVRVSDSRAWLVGPAERLN
jgi:diaminopimelate epimerase